MTASGGLYEAFVRYDSGRGDCWLPSVVPEGSERLCAVGSTTEFRCQRSRNPGGQEAIVTG